MTDVAVLVLTGYGLNCDHETAHAFELAGARSKRVHINSLINREVSLDDFHILVFGGGFSWGDDHGAGVIQAVRMKTHLGDAMCRFIEAGRLVLGICNGFQTLVNLGLLPGMDNDYKRRSVALTYNDCGNFRDDWVTLKVNKKSSCVFTKDLDLYDLPVRHGEGKFICDTTMLDRLEENNQVVLRYALTDGSPADGKFPENPNGSLHDIAGICDPTGRVFGLMPHPEGFMHVTNHPQWTFHREEMARQQKPFDLRQVTPGVKMMQNAVTFIRQSF